jgi:DnaJ-class molecular chaperone
MSLRTHRGEKPRSDHVKASKDDAYLVRTKQHEPAVCGSCYGKGYVFDVVNNGDAPVTCERCEGEGEV